MTNNETLLPVTNSDVQREIRVAISERWDRTVDNMWSPADEAARLRHHTEVAVSGFRRWHETQAKGNEP